MPKPPKTWKSIELRIARFFGTKRNRLSGSSGRQDITRSDSIHPNLFIESKHSKHPNSWFNAGLRKILKDGQEYAEKENKTFVAALHPQGKGYFWVIVKNIDLVKVADEVKEI